MEGRLRRNSAQVSPERCVVWTESSDKHRTQMRKGSKVSVVYYLCKNNLLEHPHFVEVPFSSSKGLYLRDVINRLVVLRGEHMASMYSWSCKRSYKNGFVWQDLAEDDLIIPARQNDYILKGSSLLNPASSDGFNMNYKNLSFQQTEHSHLRNEETCSSLLHVSTVREMKPLSPSRPSSPNSPVFDSSPPCHQNSTILISSSSSGECRPNGALDASTQTEDRKGMLTNLQSCFSTDREMSGTKINDEVKDETTKNSKPWNTGMGTLVSLIRAEVEKLHSLKEIEVKGLQQSESKDAGGMEKRKETAMTRLCYREHLLDLWIERPSTKRIDCHRKVELLKKKKRR